MAEVDAGVDNGFQRTTPWAPPPPPPPPPPHDHHHHYRYHHHRHNHHLVPYDEACGAANKEWTGREGGQRRFRHQPSLYEHRARLWSDPPPPPPKSSLSRHHHQHRPKIEALNRSGYGGGPGMQAFFINSCPRPSSGTGVFLPQRRDPDAHESSSKKHACAPVLLPTRVVQALNLNVHALGLQISPRQDVKREGVSGDDDDSGERRDGGNGASHCGVVSQNRSFSPHVFLPKEWTY